MRSFKISQKLEKLLVVAVLSAVMLTSVGVTLSADAQNFDAGRLYNRGIDYYSRGEVPLALSLFKKSVVADPTYSDAYYNMGTIYYRQKRYAEAIQSFEKVLELVPADAQARYNLGLAYEKVGQPQKAAQVLQEILPGDSKYQRAQAKIKSLQHQPQQTASGHAASTAASSSSSELSASRPAESAVAKSPSQIQTAASTATNSLKFSVKTFAEGFAGPTGIAVGPNGSVFVANYSKNMIYKLDKLGNKEVFAKDSGLKGPVGIVFNHKAQEFYVANYLGNSVSKVARDGRVSVLASGLKKPYYLMLEPNTNTLFISEQGTNTVSMIQLRH